MLKSWCLPSIVPALKPGVPSAHVQPAVAGVLRRGVDLFADGRRVVLRPGEGEEADHQHDGDPDQDGRQQVARGKAHAARIGTRCGFL